VQGYGAGAHRGTFGNDDAGRGRGLLSLIGEVAAVTPLPLIAAGGIMEAAQVRAVLAMGAAAAQCGTAFLRSPESGAHPLHKAALADPRYTATTVTRSSSCSAGDLRQPASCAGEGERGHMWRRREVEGS
jgi:nitronate monooxygenase